MDYLEYYGLREHPFSNVVDSRFYYHGRLHSDALTKLRYAVDTKKGLSVVIGDIGTGKTTLARRFLEELDEDAYEAALLVVVHSSVSSEWLFRKFAIQLGVKDLKDDKVELLALIYKRLSEINEEGKKAIVMIDEVQMLKNKPECPAAGFRQEAFGQAGDFPFREKYPPGGRPGHATKECQQGRLA